MVGGVTWGNPDTQWLVAGEGAGLPDGSASRLVQLSSRRETIYTGCLGNAEKGKTVKYGHSTTIRS